MTNFQLKSSLLQSDVNGSAAPKRFRILFLAPFAPHLEASHGGSRVIAQLIDHLAQRHSIALCYLRGVGEPAVDGLLKEHCEVVEEVVIPQIEDHVMNRWVRRLRVWEELIKGRPLWAIDRFSSAYGERVKALLKTWRPDIVQIEFHIMGQYLSALADDPVPRILVQHEPGEAATREIMRSPFAQGRIIPQLDVLAWKRFEREVTRQVQTVVVFTERDRETVSRLGEQTPIVQIPLGTEIPDLPPLQAEGEPPSLLFVGNFRHLPNLDAADRLINTIFPSVQAQFPTLRLFVVGEHLPADILRRANDNVILTGYVPDVKPYLDRATVVVVPLRLGGGMRVKVLEALAAAKPVIASARALEGLDLVDGEQVILAEDDDEFARAIVDLLGDPERQASLASRARDWAIANLSWERTAVEYEALYRNLLEC